MIQESREKILLILQEILSQALGVKLSNINIQTPFIEMGADSLILLQFNRAIKEKLGVDIPFRLLLEDFPTIDTLASHINQKLPPQELKTEPLSLQPNLTTTPQTLTELPFSAQAQATQAVTAGTVLEQVVAQQLQLMSKQLDLLRKAGLSNKIVPSLKTDAQVARTSTPISQPLVNQEEPTRKVGLSLHQQKHLDALITEFVERTKESKRLTQDYRSCHANSRAIAGFLPLTKEIVYPIHGQRGEGARLWDVDGNEYVDISMGFGSLLFGHSPSFIIAAVQEQIQQGILNGPQSSLAGEVAKLICELTGTERVAFCNDGSEAVMGAIRIARAATGRSKIALFAGSYHGIYDGVLVRGVTTNEGTQHSVPRAIGIPSYIAEDAIVLDYGNPESIEILKTHAHELAAVLVEPIQSSHPELQPKEFLFQLRQFTKETGIVLIFDEVITGFRMHPGGIQGLWNIQADLTTYGKAVAGGMPIGVVAGKAALMDVLDGGMWNYGDKSYPEAETTIFAGTFFKHPLVMAAAWAALNHIKNRGAQLQEELTQRTTKLAEILNDYFEQRQVPIRVVHFGSLFRFTASSPLQFGNLFFYYLLKKGVYVWEGRTLYLSTAHTDADIDRIIRAVKESVVEMQQGEFLPSLPLSTTPQETIKVPLTEAQKELWFLAQIGDKASRAYNESRYIHLRGAFNLSAVHKAIQEIINRHEALRTTFSPQGDYQIIHPTFTIDIPVSDFSILDPTQREAQLSEFLAREAQQTFELEQGPLLRFHLVKLEEKHHLLVMTNHHIVADGWSIGILLRELAAIYSAECQGIACQLPQPQKFSDYALWQTQMQQSPEMTKARAYWLEQFASSVPVLELPSDRPRPSIFTYTGARENIILASSLYNDLKTLSGQRGYTLFTILLASFMAFLQRLANQQDIVVGIASAGQSSIAGKYLVGHCVNLLPIRNPVIKNPTFIEYLSLVQNKLLDAYEHQNYPFIKLIEELKLPRDPSRTPLFTVGFNLDKAEVDSISFKQEFEVVKNSPSATKLDLSLNVAQTDNQLLLEFEYNTDLFDSQTIQRWIGYYVTLLEGLIAHPEQNLWNLPLLTKTEQHQLLVEWNNTEIKYSQNQCIHQLFEAQAEKTPDAVAVVYENQQLTYRELNQQANQLAHYLQKLGVKPEVLVGICVERSLEMIVGVLGILKAGGAYVPLDPAYPQERLNLMVGDANLSLLLTQQQFKEWLPKNQSQTIYIDADWQLIAQESQENPITKAIATNLAYVIYTSGSTGKPKGVMVQHHSLVNYTETAIVKYAINSSDRILQFASICFDAAAEEIFPCLIKGATLVLRNDAMLSSIPAFLQQCQNWKITVLDLPTAFWHQMTGELLEKSLQLPEQLRLVIIGGEKALSKYLAIWEKCVDKKVKLINSYGPTETTIVATISYLSDCQTKAEISVVPIGRAIDNVQIYILDSYLQPTPIGIPGELYIGGMGIARGYLNQPQLTAEKFIPNPFSHQPGTRLYKTGDLARYLPNGEIEILGRVDYQVKIRGFRIELGEIEARLNQHPNVSEAVVKVWEDEGDKRLVGYVSSQVKPQLTVSQLRSFLKEQLPEYMIPSAFVILETFPLTPNGKIDWRALPAPEKNRPELAANYVIPQTKVEQTIAKIWQKALNIEQIGIHDNFFELGGHSLLMIKVHSELQEIFKTDLLMLDLFRYPTISSLAEYINQLQNQITSAQNIDNQAEKMTAAKEQQQKRLQKMKSLRNI
ncbi:MAG: amino acid adenylation domain-containing protein [Chlorogloeopsis fritschii C42_A2020_084]|uniref:non-ribosomal peptide synthetase n=1 Tax=Chlorogloeopsis fritschii TaxID=1124 RepID=UPI0019E1B50A|nr:non-ribosomal peptide synthetase [Chlorogloeopsis fritschii]MBF2007873.1 amino acid adenylation domain-containing protein [Chlorogloeopsis fritschii C42_A2020_084]